MASSCSSAPACPPKAAAAGLRGTPRLAVSSRAAVVARMEGAAQGGLQTVMKWKTVVAIFVVVVVYLVTGWSRLPGVGAAAEEAAKRTLSPWRKAGILWDHICVSPRAGDADPGEQGGCAIASPAGERAAWTSVFLAH